MDDHQKALLETKRAEALGLFQMYQVGRNAAERVGSLLIALVAITVAAGITTNSDDVGIVLSPLVLALVSSCVSSTRMSACWLRFGLTWSGRSTTRLGRELCSTRPLLRTSGKQSPLKLSMRVLRGATLVVVVAVVIISLDSLSLSRSNAGR